MLKKGKKSGKEIEEKLNLNIGHLDVVFYFRLLIVLFLDKKIFFSLWNERANGLRWSRACSSYSIPISFLFFFFRKTRKQIRPH